MRKGWLKLHYGFTEWEWYGDIGMVRLFLHLLLSANSCAAACRGSIIPRGALVRSVRELSEQTGLSVKAVRTCLDKLCRTGEISVTKTKNHHVISICNFDNYQSSEEMQGQTKGQTQGQTKGKQNAPATPCGSDTCTASEEMRGKQRANPGANKRANEGQTKGQTKGQTEGQTVSEFSKDATPCASDTCAPSDSTQPKAEGKQKGKPRGKQKGKQKKNILNTILTSSDGLDERAAAPACEKVRDDWNATCTALPRVQVLSEARRNKLRLRIREMGGEEQALPLLHRIFEKIQASAFLRGEGRNGWRATFDWCITNDTNWAKILEGQYDETFKQPQTHETDTDSRGGNSRRHDEFARHIAERLSSPDFEPDLSGAY